MDMADFMKRIDAQIKEQKERDKFKVRGERRQKVEAVSEERRSGQDRRRRNRRAGDPK